MKKLIVSFCSMLLVIAAPIISAEGDQFPGGQNSCRDVVRGIDALSSGDTDSAMGMLGVYVGAYTAGVVTGWNMGQMNRSLLKQPSYRMVDLDHETRTFLLKKYCREHKSEVLTNAVYFSVILTVIKGQTPRIQQY